MSSKMDFCSWCVGDKEAAHLTKKGLSGGVCSLHKESYLQQLKDLILSRKGK